MKSIKQILENASDEQRNTIFHLWNASQEADGKNRLLQIETLTNRMLNPIAARFVWEYLSQDEQQILYRVLPPITRNGVPQDNSFVKKTSLTSEGFSIALQGLIQKGLLETHEEPVRQNIYVVTKSKKPAKAEKITMMAAISESAEALYNSSREYFTPSGDHSRWDLDRLLTTLSHSEVSKVLSYYGYTTKHKSYYGGLNDPTLVAPTLLNIEEPLEHLTDFDATARKLFVWLREHDGKGSLASARTFLQTDDETLLQTLTTLTRYALVFDGFSKQEHILFVASDWYSNMVSLSPVTVQLDGNSVTEFEGDPAAIKPSENIAIYDLAMIINTIYQQTIEPTQAGRVPKRIAAKIRSTLRGQPRLDYNDDDDYIEILLEFLEHYHIIQLTTSTFQDVKPAYEVTAVIEQWAEKTLLEQTIHLVAYWLDNFKWIDVYGVNYRAANTYSWDASNGRMALLKHLYNCNAGQWYTVDSLVQEIWRDDAFAYRPSTYGSTKSRKKDHETYVKWERCEGEVYRGILASTLYEFGIVDIGYSEALNEKTPHNPDYFMLTDMGDELIELIYTQGQNYEGRRLEASPRGLVVQPNFELLLLQPDISTLYTLLPFTQAKQLGLVSSFTLTKASVNRGLDSGLNIEQIIQTLKERSQNEIPQNVDYTLRDWTKTYKSVRISQVLLFEVSSEEAGKVVAILPALENMGMRQLAPCTFTVSGDVNLQALRKELEKAGVFVHISGDIFTRPKHVYDPYFSTFGR